MFYAVSISVGLAVRQGLRSEGGCSAWFIFVAGQSVAVALHSGGRSSQSSACRLPGQGAACVSGD